MLTLVLGALVSLWFLDVLLTPADVRHRRAVRVLAAVRSAGGWAARRVVAGLPLDRRPGRHRLAGHAHVVALYPFPGCRRCRAYDRALDLAEGVAA